MANKKLIAAFSLITAVIILIVYTPSCKNSVKKTHDAKAVLNNNLNDSFNVRPLTNIKYERTDQRLKHGKYMVTSILQCLTCHSPRDWNAPGAPPIAGKEGSGGTTLQEDSITRIIAPNITSDKETGAGTWTDDMLARAIREGVGHDGRALNWQMPYWTFRNLSEEDLASVVVYLRTLPPVHHIVPPTKLSAEEKLGTEKSLSPLTEPVATRDLSDPIKRGSYLVKIGECVGCHTSHAEYNPGLLGGRNEISRFGKTAFSANITADASGMAYGPEGFIFVIRTGKGGTLSPIMPWIAFKNMNDEDLKAIYAYLKTFPPSQHYVSSQPPFTHCAICGIKHGFGDKNKRIKPAEIKLDSRVYKQYVGTYRDDIYNSSFIISKEGNKLIGQQWENGPKTELIPQSESQFLAAGWVLPVNFVKDKNDRVVQITESTDIGRTFKKIK